MSEPPPKKIGVRERRKIVLLLATAGLLLVIGAYWLRTVVGPLLLALCFAYVLDPLVLWMRARLRLSRPLAVFFVFLVFLGLAGTALWYIIQQGIALYEAAFGEEGFLLDLPVDAADWVKVRLPPWFPGQRDLLSWLQQMSDQSPKLLTGAVQAGQTALEAGLAAFGTLFTLLSVAVLFPIYLYYFMLDLPKILTWVKVRLPGRNRERILGVAGRIHAGMSAFLRGRVVIAIIKGLLTAFGLILVGIPYAFVVGMIAGLLSILPFVGAALGLVTSVILVLATQMGAGSLIGVVVVFVVAESIEGYVLYPLILSDKLDMHPVTMLFSVLAWGAIFGIFGVLVAIPLTIVVRAIFQEFLLRPLETLASEDAEAGHSS